MHNNKKSFLTVLLTIVTTIVSSIRVFAQSQSVGGRPSELLDAVENPIKKNINSPDQLLNTLLPFVLTGAGLILFVMLIMGGFDMLTAGTDAKKADAGKARITQAIIGFIVIFAAYWITQIIEIVLGVSILK